MIFGGLGFLRLLTMRYNGVFKISIVVVIRLMTC
jgi:hypothetical protein